jgi:hypothetical protein
MNESQSIGKDARAALFSNEPRRWALSEMTGVDFGYDFSVTCFQAGSDETTTASAQLTLYLQLKGTTRPDAKSTDGKFISQSIELSTIRMWHNSQTPIVLVVADLIESRDPKLARVHYKFLSPELDDLLDSLPINQKTTAIRVPTTQLVHRELDMLAELMIYVEECREARRQWRREHRAAGAAADSLSVNALVLPQQSVHGGLLGDFDKLVASLPNSQAFQEALQALRYGHFDRVLTAISVPPQTHVTSTRRMQRSAPFLPRKHMQRSGI